MIEQLGGFWQSQTTRLMAVYIAIIMAMSLAFSVSLYVVSAEQLDRQIPGQGFVDDAGKLVPSDRIGRFLKESVATAKEELLLRLYALNLIVLVFGTAFSYLLARWTLDPIERNVAAQTRFVSDASHELRTPLTAIQTTNEVALRRKKLTLKEAREVLQMNLDDVQRLQRLTTMLLQVAADEMPLSLQPVPVRQLVERAISTTAPAADGRNITVTNAFNDSNLLVEADPDAAAQALTVLVDNAIKYSPGGQTVTISATRRRSAVLIHVKDHGSGIARNDQKRIFERFYRTDQARQRTGAGGYGLGLEIAQNIARHHGGTIELRSAPGRGSTFSLVLPLAK